MSTSCASERMTAAAFSVESKLGGLGGGGEPAGTTYTPNGVRCTAAVSSTSPRRTSVRPGVRLVCIRSWRRGRRRSRRHDGDPIARLRDGDGEVGHGGRLALAGGRRGDLDGAERAVDGRELEARSRSPRNASAWTLWESSSRRRSAGSPRGDSGTSASVGRPPEMRSRSAEPRMRSSRVSTRKAMPTPRHEAEHQGDGGVAGRRRGHGPSGPGAADRLTPRSTRSPRW